MAAGIQYYGTGRRKTSTARVFLRPGSGTITVNKQPLEACFPTESQRLLIRMPFVVTELVAGESLATRHEILSPSSALDIGAQVASALAAAHEACVVHGNIKPSNIVLTPAGVKVVDFAMPFADGDATPAGDVCALGLLIYWMLVREVPWPSEMS